MLEPVNKQYLERNTVLVAKDLIGKYIIRDFGAHQLIARIVETEAYSENDPACHAWSAAQKKKQGKPPTGRSSLLFKEAGLAYVYLNYGIHWLFNVVTDVVGVPGAVLIRAVEPLDGIEIMRHHRPKAKKDIDLTNGPGKLAAALAIGKEFNGKSLLSGPLVVARDTNCQTPPKIETSGRIGISKAKDFPWRFYERNNKYVSPAKI